jgi:hypothetical protein
MQSLDLGIDRQPAEIADFAVIIVQAKGDADERSGREVTADEIARNLVKLGVGVRRRTLGRGPAAAHA